MDIQIYVFKENILLILKKVRDRTMQITIRGHHLSITPAIEENIKTKFSQMTKHLDQVNSMQVKLSKDHQITKRSKKGSSNHIAEAIVRLPGIEFFAQATADDMYTSIKLLSEKLKRQIDRYRKMTEHQHVFAL